MCFLIFHLSDFKFLLLPPPPLPPLPSQPHSITTKLTAELRALDQHCATKLHSQSVSLHIYSTKRT